MTATGKHPSHVTRSSDASSYDEVCTNCGATDISGGGWGKLVEPCGQVTATPEALPVEQIRNEAIELICAEANELGYCDDDISDFRSGLFDGGDLLTLQAVERALLTRTALEQPSATEASEAVAVIGKDWSLLWASPDTLSAIVERTGIKIGSPLYASPQPSAVQVEALKEAVREGLICVRADIAERKSELSDDECDAPEQDYVLNVYKERQAKMEAALATLTEPSHDS